MTFTDAEAGYAAGVNDRECGRPPLWIRDIRSGLRRNRLGREKKIPTTALHRIFAGAYCDGYYGHSYKHPGAKRESSMREVNP